MAPADSNASIARSGRNQDDDAGYLGRPGRRDGQRLDGQREERSSRESHDRHDRHDRYDRHDRHGPHRPRRRSRTPDATRPRHDRRQRDRERSRGRDQGRVGSPDRPQETSPSRHRTRRRSRHDTSSDGRSRNAQDAERHDSHRQRGSLIKHRGPLPSQQNSFAVDSGQEAPEKEKDKPNWANTGALAAASNLVAHADGTSTTLKYHEPVEARMPLARHQWKLFVFKGNDIVDTIHLNLKSCWLVGRDSGVADVVAEHPSVSKQHAIIQFRYMEKRNEYGDQVGRVKPYLLDLESANGTSLNDGAVPSSRYLELRPKDMIQFGDSTREYVVMLAPGD